MAVMIDLPQQFGKYVLVERITIGGMAEIFKTQARGLGGFEKLLAIKRLHPRYSEDQDFIHMLVDEAKIAVQQNSTALQKKLSERQALLGKIDQANMQEEMNKAMTQLSATVGEDVPTLEEVRSKVEARYAKAKGMSELQGASVEGRMLEVEQAAMNVEAQGRLAEIKAQLGITVDEAPEAATTPGAIGGESVGSEAPSMPEGETQTQGGEGTA